MEAMEQGWLPRWLFLAGFRRPAATTNFLLATAAAIGAGLTVVLVVRHSGILKAAARAAADIPGGMGSLAQPVLQVAPWLVMGMLAMLPMAVVRAARRHRVAQVERDLPITLELLATLAESGIGFDAAVGRILDSQPTDRVFPTELRTLQAELLAGRSRVDCLRRVARRLDVVSVTIFISAIVQAEQIGSGVANVLRGQADDLRQRRRTSPGVLDGTAREAIVSLGRLFSSRNSDLRHWAVVRRVPQVYVVVRRAGQIRLSAHIEGLCFATFSPGGGQEMLTDWSLTERASGRVVARQVELAAGYWSRLRGLQFRAALPAGHGLLLVPCGSIHTFFVRFAINVVFLDSTGDIVGVHGACGAGAWCWHRGEPTPCWSCRPAP